MPAYGYFPATYQPIYNQQPYVVQQQQQQQQQPTIQQSGFVRVQSENEARMYPVAPGNSITFIDENAPYCYTKTMDFSQLDRPKFEKYRLVKEEDQPIQAAQSGEQSGNVSSQGYATKADVEALRGSLNELEEKVAKLSSKKTIRVKEAADDE